MDATSPVREGPPPSPAPPLASLPPPPPAPSLSAAAKPPEVLAAWPPSAVAAGAFLLGCLVTALSIQALGYLRAGTAPAEISETRPITYRVELNEARRAELLQLPGVGPSLADRIEDYRRTSGGFHSVDELRNVQGIGPTILERLRPFVWVKAPPRSAAPQPVVQSGKAEKAPSGKLAALTEPIDVNHAALTELQKLPGIGPKMSQRIVDEREKRPFATVEELRRVTGIGPKTLEKLKPLVTVGEPK
jgi:competence protein ComEA